MSTIFKTFDVEIVEKRDNGGRIMISTGSYDRDNDRVIPGGGKFTNYLKNPVVQYGHNYREPWATVGRTTKLEITKTGIIADFDLRPAASESDPQNIVLLLWNGDWVRTASIGFSPIKREDNEREGIDFAEWELLEWSIVPIPSNQEALRQAVKAYPEPAGAPAEGESETGKPKKRVTSSADSSHELPSSGEETLGADPEPPSSGEEKGDLPTEDTPSGELSTEKSTRKAELLKVEGENEQKLPESDEKLENPPKTPKKPESEPSEELDAPKLDDGLLDAVEAFIDEVTEVFTGE